MTQVDNNTMDILKDVVSNMRKVESNDEEVVYLVAQSDYSDLFLTIHKSTEKQQEPHQGHAKGN